MEWKSSPSLAVTTLPSGTTGKVKRGGSGGGPDELPFTPFDATVTPGSPKAGFTPGLVDRIVPSIGGDRIVLLVGDPARPPALDLPGASGYVWIKCPLDATGVATDAVFEAGAEVPDPAPDFAYRPAAYYEIADGLITRLQRLLFSNQSHKRCGGESTWGQA